VAAVLAEPDAAKAAVQTSGQEMTRFSVPIEKWENTGTINPVDGTPDIEIWGKVTDGTLDSDLQIVDPEWSLAAIKQWFKSKANIRLGHDPKRPVGKGIEVDGHHVKGLIADPVAKHLVRTKVLNDWSIGIMLPDVRKNDPRFRHLDPQGKAVNGVITGRPDGLSQIGEISVVDRGSNFGTAFQLVKAAADGTPEWTGELTAPAEVLAKAASPSVTKGKLASVDLPADMKLKISPLQLAKMQALKRELVLKEAAEQAAAESAAVVTKSAQDEEDTPELAAIKAAEAAVYKRDIDTATRRRLAAEGHALPNLSYPIENTGDLQNAADLARSGHGDVAAATALIGREARRLKVPNPMSKKPKAKKAATPDAVKCMKCGGSGMVEDKPCPDCKCAAAEPAIGKKKGKLRALCANCGAKQNPDHNNCPECGHALPARPVIVAKNHNFVCLGCGADLDKGEKFCPGCGKENPGHNPMADLKIPANMEADKSAGKDRVAKAKKKSGKKGEPFGGRQAKPFGEKDEPDESEAKTAEPAVAKKKGKGKGRSPAAGVKGHETAPLPPHREPDGAPVEQFENDAMLQDGDQQMKAAMRHKNLGVEPHLAVLHDLCCPAFSPADVSKALPHASFAAIDTNWWTNKALEAACGSDPVESMRQYNAWQAMSRAAVTLKTADPAGLDRIRQAGHEAFLDANRDLIKTFHDATPGPGTAPTPGHVMPGSFRRPYISAGHAAESPQADGPRTFPVISDHPQAQDFHRGYIAAGHGSESPDNGPRSEPMPTGPAGAPQSRAEGAMAMHARDYDQAVSAMHDHLSRIAPGMCPMSPPMGSTQKPAPQVPEAVGGPEPHKAKASKADKAAKRAARKARTAKKAARVAAQKARRQRKAGRLAAEKAAAPGTLAPILPVPVDAPPALDADTITAAVKAAVAPLAKRQRAQDRALRKQRTVLNAIAGQPDTSRAPYRGAGGAITKASAGPAAPQTAAEAAALAQTGHLQRLHHDWRHSHIPEVREAAYAELTAHLGLSPMTNNPTPMNPFTT
jgi:hypothetical protein